MEVLLDANVRQNKNKFLDEWVINKNTCEVTTTVVNDGAGEKYRLIKTGIGCHLIDHKMGTRRNFFRNSNSHIS